LLRPDSGKIWLDGEEVSMLSETQLAPIRKKCAMVFQSSTLFDSMTCAENVALPLRLHRGLSMKDALEEAARRLGQVHMQAFGASYPAELGDGMRKRVAIARALTLEPRYVLFDEPTTSLDPVSARRVDQMIRELCDTVHVTAIVVSHDVPSILGIADRIAMLYKGRVQFVGTPAEIRVTTDPIVRQFIEGRAQGPIDS
jgi:phospholipid/cholesterol/gamma-HCH transport system ATP-binding protein